MYTYVPYGQLGYIIDTLFFYENINRFILHLLVFERNISSNKVNN